MAQASLAPCRQADILHNRKRHRAPLSISTSSRMPPGREADGHKAWARSYITCRTCSCSCESSGRRSHADPGISSAGRPVSILADITLLAVFSAELLQKFVQALTKNVSSKLLYSPLWSQLAGPEHLSVQRPVGYWHIGDRFSPA